MEGLIRELAPHLRSQQLLLFLQGTGAVNYMMLKAALQDCVTAGPISTSLADRMPMYAAAKVLPWACRLQAPAQVTVCGTKERVKLALAPDACGLLRVMLPRLLDGLFPGTRFLLDANAVLEHTYFPYGLLCSDVIVSAGFAAVLLLVALTASCRGRTRCILSDMSASHAFVWNSRGTQLLQYTYLYRAPLQPDPELLQLHDGCTSTLLPACIQY